MRNMAALWGAPLLLATASLASRSRCHCQLLHHSPQLAALCPDAVQYQSRLPGSCLFCGSTHRLNLFLQGEEGSASSSTCSSCKLPHLDLCHPLPRILTVVTLLSYCDVLEITEEALTNKLAATGGKGLTHAYFITLVYTCFFFGLMGLCIILTLVWLCEGMAKKSQIWKIFAVFVRKEYEPCAHCCWRWGAPMWL